MKLLSSLKREEKEAIGLLQIGTFLEYFDLFLYVHLAVLLNDLFFPKTDPHAASILAATALCATFIFRPIGALVFGWIGDHIGRKKTIIITTTMMAVSCLVMANLPTYAQVGILATWAITICRIAQGMSSMGEIIGAEIYLTESIHGPLRYPATAFLSVANNLGSFFAIAVAFCVTSYNLNWRLAFWLGAIIAVIGAIARKRLRETPVFLEMQRKWMLEETRKTNLEYDPVHGAELNRTWKEPRDNRTLLSYFLISCGHPLSFYLVFIYFNPILKENFGYSSTDIIQHNFFLALLGLNFAIIIAYLSSRIYPLKITKLRGICCFLLMVSLPFLVTNVTSSGQLFFIQALLVTISSLGHMPSIAVFVSYFPFYRRFTHISMLFAVSRALMYPITSFGFIYLSSYFGHFGLWFITLPIALAFLYGVSYFQFLERKKKDGTLWEYLASTREAKKPKRAA